MLELLGYLMFMFRIVDHLGNYDFSVKSNPVPALRIIVFYLTPPPGASCSFFSESSDHLHISECRSAAVLSSVTVFVCCCFFLSSSVDFPLSFKHNDNPLDELCNLHKVQTPLIMFKSTPNMPTDLTHN